MGTLFQDVHYAARQLSRNPGFTLTAVLSLVLGIGGATAVFSEINAYYLRPLPVHEPARLVSIFGTGDRGQETGRFSYPDYVDLREGAGALSGLAAHASGNFGVSDDNTTEVLSGEFVSPNYFEVLGLRPTLGRYFVPDDATPGGAPVVVLGWNTWQRRFDADSLIVGRVIRLNGHPFTVIGIAERTFNGANRAVGQDVWVPASTYPLFNDGFPVLQVRGFETFGLIGRLAPGVSRERAQAALNVRIHQLGAELPQPGRVNSVRVERFLGLPAAGWGSGITTHGLALWIAGLVLLIACVNVAGMLAVRAAVRQREIAVRLVMGASRMRLVRQLLTESMLLWLIGGAGGLLLAVWIADLRDASTWPPLPVRLTLEFGVDGRVLAFALGVSLLTGTAFGLLPALQATRPDVAPALKSMVEPTRRGSRLRDVFVAGQIAASLVVLVSAGLFLRTLQHALTLDPGFDARGVAFASVDLRAVGYSGLRGRAFYEELFDRLRANPEVESVALATVVPLTGTTSKMPVRVGERDNAGVNSNTITPGFFRTMGIPLVRGRAFSDADVAGAPRVGIINESMARRFWPGKNPLGEEIGVGPERVQIVGIARDIKFGTLKAGPGPHLFMPFAQDESMVPSGEMQARNMSVLVRGLGDPDVALAALRREVRALDTNVPLTMAMPLRDVIAASLGSERAIAVRTGIFALIGLTLAAVGLYGLIAHLVVQRTREIGVRMALGARTGHVLRLVLRRGMRLAAAGMVLGVAASLGTSRLIASRIYGVSPTDPLTYVGVALLLIAVALLASYLPARRATRVDPMIALRAE
jgi:predicted permease